jgi:hypothetical protein
MKTDILQILHEEATTQYNPNGKDERVVNSDEFDTVANQIVNLFKDKKYTEENIREAIDMARMVSHVSCFDDVEYRLKYTNTEDDIINSLNKED